MPDSPRLTTAKSYLSIFRTLDTHQLSSLLSEKFTQTFAPSSISPPGPFDKPGFIAHLTSLTKVMTGFPITILDVIESENSNAVWAHCTAMPEWRVDAMGGGEGEDGQEEEALKKWGFKGEYVFMMWMDASEEKVERCVEMLDSAATLRLMGLMGKAKENIGRK
ncbi:hypothetical protein K458DRAFT_374466 [Lentithecium fluviatile CBS 122367]|uniref:SnoaL-like domain-containing protein n=1 Tax=Lentithecium fluviatile CBS 122367 TaxID=1168545 RepID=A0A6G1IP81_9PLEO|nr:hypothetical protein K458DRAFT_374466 [Lentithecium fluviatile CBS 122367]